MKRLYFALAILFALAVIVGTGTSFVYKANKDMTSIINKIEKSARADDILSAATLCESAERQWVDYEEKLNLFVNHAEVCEIGVSLSSLKPLIEHDEKAEFFCELNKVKTMLTHFASMENIHNE